MYNKKNLKTPQSLSIKRRKAFALVLSLVLMGFMVLLIISLASIVTMQLRQSRQGMNEIRAKQAAKYAAYQALAQIQSSLGPDQRVTANAMIFDEEISDGVATLETDSRYEWWEKPANLIRSDVNEVSDQAISQNRYWVGVWDSRNAYAPKKILKDQSRKDYAKNTVDEAITWLVSGNKIKNSETDSEGFITFKPTSVLEDGSYVRAVGGGSVSDELGARVSERDVRVPVVTLDKDPNPVSGEIISDGKETRIAWWVSDEGQKASLNAVASEDFLTHAKNIDYRVQSLPFFSGIHGLSVSSLGNAFDFNFEDSGDDSSLAQIRNLSDVKELDVYKSERIPDSMHLSKVLFHDVTFDSKGLLVNVRDGGLKKDLSLGLAMLKSPKTSTAFGNEPEVLGDDDNDVMPEYFERPYGVAGFDYKSSAYPLMYKDLTTKTTAGTYARRINDDRQLKGVGHMFGPQMYGHEDMKEQGGYKSASTILGTNILDLFKDKYLWKDPGGPLWDQLRSYYNLRTDDDAANGKLEARVQTDDRFGFKPIVKRFQVFFVPSFVDYGSSRYGLRLHIIPLLILYNPYDTKIAGETYYAIRYSGSESAQPGSFRFAIGYKSGNRFQSLRDLRTELMPSLNSNAVKKLGDNVNVNNYFTDTRGLYFSLSLYGYWGGNWDTYNPGGSDSSQAYLMSTKTNFYNNRLGLRALPLGYGLIAPGEFSQSSSDPNSHWKSVVSDSNLYPDINETQAVWQSLNEETEGKWGARVARIPLFLNNLIMTLNHGRYDYRGTFNNQVLFKMQRNICADKPELSSEHTAAWGPDSDFPSDFFFMAYDKRGIDAGKAKIFAMERIVSYIGKVSDYNNMNNTYLQNGPYGNIENANDLTTDYEKKKALMLPLDDGGKIGGCFYIDIPHPEVEHFAKYNGNEPYDYSHNSRYTYVLFDLNDISTYRNQMRDIMGQYPPLNIQDYYIDMQDMVGNQSSQHWVGRALNMMPNSTPIGYGIYSYQPDYYKSNGGVHGFGAVRYSRTYLYVNLTVWIWKREGFLFRKFVGQGANNGYVNNDASGTPEQAPYPELGPVLLRAEGLRLYMGDENPSFPDPSLEYNFKADQDQDILPKRNAHFPGVVGYDDRTSLIPYVMEAHLNGSRRNFWDADNAVTLEAKDEYRDISTGTSDEFRARYYINWLGFNPRRHSANSWTWYNGPTNNSGRETLMDLAPNAMRGNFGGSFMPEFNQYDYEDKIASALSNQQGKIPYGFIYSAPYAKNESGNQPYFNRRLFVNGSIRASVWDRDYCAQDITNMPSGYNTLYNVFGSLQKNSQAFSQIYGTKGDGMTEIGFDVIKSGDGYVNVGMEASKGTNTAPIFHILRKTEVVSNPANLAAANLNFGAGMFTYQLHDGVGYDVTFQKSYGLRIPESMMTDNAIGNSLAPSRVSPERSYQVTWIDGYSYDSTSWASKTIDEKSGNKGQFDGKRENNWYEDRNVVYDMSWQLNNVLWDEYFFSTVPYRMDERADVFDSKIAYPQNPRLQYVSKSDYIDMEELTGDVYDHFEENSAKMWINGPFNVNSTSVDAWKAVLSTYYDQEVKGYDGTNAQLSNAAAFHRWGAPFKATEVDENTSMSDESAIMQGFRALSDDELEELAVSIVEHVKDRGPFYSMSHFVNRVVANPSAEERFTDKFFQNSRMEDFAQYDDRKNLSSEYNDNITHKITHSQKGALQAAIDSTKINSQFFKDYLITPDADGDNMSDGLKNDPSFGIFKDPKKVWENWRAAVGPQATGAPGYLMQQDILSRLGSFLTVRSDTFKIRAYGEVRNPISGIVEGKAWCEMVVQRYPEYIDTITENQEAWRVSDREIEIGSNNDATTRDGKNLDEFIDELSDINKTLGRRFKIVSFRWLNEKEI